MAVRYVKVHFRGSIRAERGLFLRVVSDTDKMLSGYEIDEHGDEIVPPGFERRLRVIHRSAIIRVREFVMSNTYATLMEVK